jgi:hypothetical protein
LNRSELTNFRGTVMRAFRSPGMVLATVAEATFTLRTATLDTDTLRNFQFVTFDSHRDRALNAGDGNHQVLALIVVENSYKTIEHTTANAYALALM